MKSKLKQRIELTFTPEGIRRYLDSTNNLPNPILNYYRREIKYLLEESQELSRRFKICLGPWEPENLPEDKKREYDSLRKMTREATQDLIAYTMKFKRKLKQLQQ
jgi:hypothetical protein